MANLELKIDSPVVSTILAEKYLEKYKKEIAGIRNKAMASTNVTIDVVLGKKELSNKIIGNAELFCHLESFIRNKPVEDVKNIDLKLIENCLLDNAQTTCNESVVFCDNTPLAVLGQISFMESKITIYCTDKTVAVCHLFMQLCHQTGFTQVSLRTTPPDAKDAFDKFVCAGVVTEKSDIDSAIDAFLSSTSEYPWKLQQILVQESVYDTFKKAVEYKSKLGKHTDGNVAEDLKRLCSELYVYKKKIFLFDYVGNNVVVIDNDYHRVRVEAYRTTRELLSMLQNVTAMSLWSSDLSEAHEIAIEAPSLLSWVNGFGNVKGSPRSSRWLTSFLNSSDNKKNNSQVNADVLMKSFKSWSKIDGKKDRMNTLAKGVEKYKEDSSSDKDLTGLVEKELLSFHGYKCLDIENGELYMNFDLPVGVVPSYVDASDDVLRVVRSLLLGNVLLVLKMAPQFSKLLTALKDAGAPIVMNNDQSVILYSTNIFKSKIVISNFGTIFAN